MSALAKTVLKDDGHVVRRVAIVGGTHGNELLGVQLIGMLEQRPEETSRPSFESVCVQRSTWS